MKDNFYLKGIIFFSVFSVLFLMAWGMLLLVISSTPQENLDSIEGTWMVPMILGTYWLGVIFWDIKSSQDLTNKILLEITSKPDREVKDGK